MRRGLYRGSVAGKVRRVSQVRAFLGPGGPLAATLAGSGLAATRGKSGAAPTTPVKLGAPCTLPGARAGTGATPLVCAQTGGRLLWTKPATGGASGAGAQTWAGRARRRREGLGSLLMREVMRRAFEEGARHAFLEVRRSNGPAIALYERLGFRTVREDHAFEGEVR